MLTARPLLNLFADIPGHREPRSVRHSLHTLLAAARAAVVVGKRSYVSIAAELGINRNTLKNWVEKISSDPGAGSVDHPDAPAVIDCFSRRLVGFAIADHIYGHVPGAGGLGDG